ncbi:hypothetical protein C6P46_005662 [Rhodotorula mucilaginosa]|uniref:Uncharacterized protein n=1 Tax=Rhodotorula mucilaginosa TaxID=5537 RepID=A0A9P7B4V3_RHOMI|nr:hypothetical protein C6P46_005662 [Rhodotorula mucilaginosa]
MRRLFGFDARPQTRIWRDGGRLGHRRKDLLKYDVDASYPTPKRWCMIRFPVSKPPKGLRPASGQAADTLGSPDHAAAVVTTSTTLLQSVDAVRPAAGRVKCCGSGWGTLLKCPLLCKRSRSSMHCSHCYLSSHPWVQPVTRGAYTRATADCLARTRLLGFTLSPRGESELASARLAGELVRPPLP